MELLLPFILFFFSISLQSQQTTYEVTKHSTTPTVQTGIAENTPCSAGVQHTAPAILTADMYVHNALTSGPAHILLLGHIPLPGLRSSLQFANGQRSMR